MPIHTPVRLLGHIAESLFMGLNFARLSKTKEDNEVPIIHVKNIVDGHLANLERLERTNVSNTPQTSKQRLLPGDILLSARGTLMKCAVVPEAHRGAIASANFIVIRLGQNAAVRPDLLWAFLRTPATQAHLESRASGSAQPALNIRELAKLPIPIPPQDIQSDLVRLILVTEEQYRCAVDCARHRQDEAMKIVEQYMDMVRAL